MSEIRILKEEDITGTIIVYNPVRDDSNNIIGLEPVLVNSFDRQGENKEYLTAKNLVKGISEDNAKELFNRFVQVIESGKPINIKFLYEKEEQKKWQQITAVKLEDRIVVSYYDIDQPKEPVQVGRSRGPIRHPQNRIEEIDEIEEIEEIQKNKKSKSIYQFIAENSSDMICLVNTEGVYQYVTPSSKKNVGYEPEELLGKTFYEFLHSDDLKTVKESFSQYVKTPYDITLANRFKTKSGEFKWLENTSVPVKNEKGETEGVLSTLRDITERKRTEEELSRLNQELEKRVIERTKELKKKQGLLQLITDSIPILIAFINPDLRIQLVNKTYHNWFGNGANTLIGKPLIEVMIENNLKGIMEAFQKMDDRQEFYEDEIKDVSGKTRYLKSSIIQDKDSEGKVNGYISVSIDITDEKTIQMKAEEINERLLTVLNNAPIVFWAINLDGILTTAEGKALKNLGFTSSELLGTSIYDIVQDPVIIEKIHKSLRGESFVVFNRFREVYFQSFYLPLKNSKGEIIGLAGISTDISDRVKMEEALQASEAKYKSMAEGLPQLIWTALPNGDSDYYNQNWYQYTGQTEEEAMKQGWRLVVHPDDVNKLAKWKYSLQTGKQLENEIKLRRKDNMYRWHLVRAWPVESEKGKIIKWVGTCTDIHDQKEKSEELKLKNKQLIKTNNDLDTFVYTASHDLRAPISNMEGLINAIESDISPECEKDIQVILKMTDNSLQKLKRTISELTEISRIQRNENGDVDNLDIEQTIEEFKSEYKDQIIQNKAEIILNLDIKNIRFSRKNFRSIIYNLLSNAIKFKSPERNVRINIRTKLTDKNNVLMTIRDNGIGFDLRQKDKIFSMFKRLHTHVEGTGVGLYIVKRLMENSKGKIDVESAIGKGTCFKLYFNSDLAKIKIANSTNN